MKKRNGFVSNSSSTSFLLLYKLSEFATGSFAKKVNFSEAISRFEGLSPGDDTEILQNGKKDVIDFLEQEIRMIDGNLKKWPDSSLDLKNKEEAINDLSRIQSIKKGWEPLLCEISIHDNVLLAIMDQMKEDCDIKIIRKEY